MYIHIYGPPNDLPRNILYGNYHVFLHIKHDRKNNNSQKGRSWGAGFCTWMFQYVWVVILISNAFFSMAPTDLKLWFDHFTPWSASPYHLLHPVVQPIMPTTILVLGHIEKSKQNLETFKTNSSKTKKQKTKLLRECLVLTQKIVFFGVP